MVAGRLDPIGWPGRAYVYERDLLLGWDAHDGVPLQPQDWYAPGLEHYGEAVSISGEMALVTAPPNPSHGPWRRLLGRAVEADIRTGP